MQIKPVTDYALRMLIYLFVKRDISNSKEISEQLNIPQKNVLSIGRNLKKAKYISITSGPYGGYTITKKSEDITVYNIISIFEDVKINCRFSLREKKGSKTMIESAADDLYYTLQCIIEEKLKSITLADLITGNTADFI